MNRLDQSAQSRACQLLATVTPLSSDLWVHPAQAIHTGGLEKPFLRFSSGLQRTAGCQASFSSHPEADALRLVLWMQQGEEGGNGSQAPPVQVNWGRGGADKGL